VHVHVCVCVCARVRVCARACACVCVNYDDENSAYRGCISCSDAETLEVLIHDALI
jgi:hypothetical protein